MVMGIYIGFSRSSYDFIDKCNLSNPNPKNFKILKNKKINDFLILWVHYPDCNNYEGRKILVFEGVTLSKLKRQKVLDPHFSEANNYCSPIARFVPTEKGWNYAINFCKNV